MRLTIFFGRKGAAPATRKRVAFNVSSAGRSWSGTGTSPPCSQETFADALAASSPPVACPRARRRRSRRFDPPAGAATSTAISARS